MLQWLKNMFKHGSVKARLLYIDRNERMIIDQTKSCISSAYRSAYGQVIMLFNECFKYTSVWLKTNCFPNLSRLSRARIKLRGVSGTEDRIGRWDPVSIFKPADWREFCFCVSLTFNCRWLCIWHDANFVLTPNTLPVSNVNLDHPGLATITDNKTIDDDKDDIGVPVFLGVVEIWYHAWWECGGILQLVRKRCVCVWRGGGVMQMWYHTILPITVHWKYIEKWDYLNNPN